MTDTVVAVSPDQPTGSRGQEMYGRKTCWRGDKTSLKALQKQNPPSWWTRCRAASFTVEKGLHLHQSVSCCLKVTFVCHPLGISSPEHLHPDCGIRRATSWPPKGLGSRGSAGRRLAALCKQARAKMGRGGICLFLTLHVIKSNNRGERKEQH